ncbi:MAG TPA: hypothetical protein VIQ30_20395 [Pseudonocardia sp.]
MARLTGPDESVRTVYLPDGRARAQGMSVPLYADEALTTPADVQTTDGDTITGTPPTVTVDAYSRIPLFLYPDGDVDVVYTSINGGPAVALYASTDDRLDAAEVGLDAADARLGTVEASLPQIPADRGYLAWTQPPYALNGGVIMPTPGMLQLRRLRRVPAATVTSIVGWTLTGGSSLTAGQCFAALYTAAGALIAQTTDQSTAWATTGLKVMPLAGGPYNLAAGDYYVGLWFNGTTGPTFARSGGISSVLTNIGLAAPNLDAAVADLGVTTSAPTTLGAQGLASSEFWFALA